MQNFADSPSFSDLNPHLVNTQNIELKEVNNTQENQIENLPMLINQITPSEIHSIPNTVINEWGTFPHEVECPFCHKTVKTKVEASCNMGSCCLSFWLSCITWAIILLVMGKEIGCADATHRCPNCKNVIGIYRSC